MKTIALVLVATAVLAQTTTFPGAVDSDTSLFVTADNIQTVLNAAMQPADSVAVLRSAARFTPNMIVTVCDTVSGNQCTGWEHMRVTAVAGNTISVTRGFAGTTAVAHASGKTAAVLIDSAHQKVLKDAVVAIETSLGPNLSNISSVITGVMLTSSYTFTPQSCASGAGCATGGPSGMNLVAGNNTITMQPVPIGLNGTDIFHYVFVSGGTGAAEDCKITGGSGTSGSASGAIIINCGHAHTGAWTVGPDGNGIFEAISMAATRGGGIVQIPAGTTLVIHAHPVLPSNTSLTGSGWSSVIQVAAGYWATGNSDPNWIRDPVYSPGATIIDTATRASGVTIKDLTIDANNAGSNGTAGNIIHFADTTASIIDHVHTINFVAPQSADVGIILSNPPGYGNQVLNSYFQGPGVGMPGTCPGGVFTQVPNTLVQGNVVDGTCDEGFIANGVARGSQWIGNTFRGTNSAFTGNAFHCEGCSDATFTGNYMYGYGTGFNVADIFANAQSFGVTISNNIIGGDGGNVPSIAIACGASAAAVTATSIVISGNSINGAMNGIAVGQYCANVVVSGNALTGVTAEGVFVDNRATQVRVAGNTFKGNAGSITTQNGPVPFPASITLSPNTTDDTLNSITMNVPGTYSVVNTAATITPPSQIFGLAGAGTITTINRFSNVVQGGTQLTMIPNAAVVFATGGPAPGIGNNVTATAGSPCMATYDTNLWWIACGK